MVFMSSLTVAGFSPHYCATLVTSSLQAMFECIGTPIKNVWQLHTNWLDSLLLFNADNVDSNGATSSAAKKWHISSLEFGRHFSERSDQFHNWTFLETPAYDLSSVIDPPVKIIESVIQKYSWLFVD